MALCLDMTRRMPTRGYVVALLVLGLAGAAGCNPVNRGGWTRETVDVPGDLYAVRALRNDRQLAVGDGSTTLANVDGTWRARNLGGNDPLRALFGLNETNVMIVGGAPGRGVAWRTDDGFFRYTAQALPGGTLALHAIHGSSMRDLWAVGDGPTAVRFDGTNWSPAPLTVPTGLTDVSLRGVHCTADNACLAVGTQGVLARWDGARWTLSVALDGRTLNAVDWLNDAWLVAGDGGLLLRVDAAGTVSQQESPESSRALLALYVAGGNDAWALGAVPREGGQPVENGQAAVLRLEGTAAWRTEDGLKSDRDLTGIHGLGGSLWAVGRGGTLFRSSR